MVIFLRTFRDSLSVPETSGDIPEEHSSLLLCRGSLKSGKTVVWIRCAWGGAKPPSFEKPVPPYFTERIDVACFCTRACVNLGTSRLSYSRRHSPACVSTLRAIKLIQPSYLPFRCHKSPPSSSLLNISFVNLCKGGINWRRYVPFSGNADLFWTLCLNSLTSFLILINSICRYVGKAFVYAGHGWQLTESASCGVCVICC